MSSGRPIVQPAARSCAVVARIVLGVQRPTRITPPSAPARTFAMKDGFGGPASAPTITSPAGAAEAGAATTSAALSASQRGSRRTLDSQACRRIEEEEAGGVDGQLQRSADARRRLQPRALP